MIEITIIMLSLIEIYAWIAYRDLKCPAVLHNVMWIVALLFSGQFIEKQDLNILAFFIIIVGAILFQIAFKLSLKITIHKSKRISNTRIVLKKNVIKILIIVIIVIALPVIYQYIRYLKGGNESWYMMLTLSEESLQLPSLFNYFRKIVQLISIAILICYWLGDIEKISDIRKYVIILNIIAILSVISVPTRNSILFYLLPIVMAYFATHNISNKRILVIGIGTISIFMLSFFIISMGKYWYIYEKSTSSYKVMVDEVLTYLSGGVAAFVRGIVNHSYQYTGGNTFRFIQAVGDRIFGTSNAIELVKEFTVLKNGVTTNVYTFYDFYIRDFGWFYAIIAQFLFGCLHGISYKGMKRKNPIQIYYYALLCYPLVMQFFQDQYVSLLSTWIQISVVGICVYKTSLFLKKEK